MPKKFKTLSKTLLAILLGIFFSLAAEDANFEVNLGCNKDACETCFYFPLANKFSIGPEIYHLQRTRDGGTKQSGWMYGGKIGYDRIQRYKFYVGLEALYAKGTLNGHNGVNEKLKSSFTDGHIEGRFGYTFQGKCCLKPAFTPFAGYGYFRDSNKFKEPSPLPLKFVTTYRYIPYGFLSSIEPAENFTLGANFKAWSLIHARVNVKDDPYEDNASMLMDEKFSYRVETPLLYRYCSCSDHLEFGLVPFFEFRHYGRRENYPFDFFDTKLKLWGVNIQINYRV